MPLINLIQEQRNSLKRGKAQARTLFYGFVAVAGLSVCGFGYFLFATDALVRQESTLKAKVAKLAPIVASIEADEKAYAELAPRVKTLEAAQGTTDKWTTILNHLTTQTPANTWLTGVRCTASDLTKPIAVSFLGMSDKQELVGELIMRLQNCPELSAVALKFTQEKIVQQGTGIEYEITAEIPGTAEEKPKEIKEEKGGA